MDGKLYAVGVGPGDPELMTLKALKIIKNADCIACPENKGEPGTAYNIAHVNGIINPCGFVSRRDLS